ncbi:hypothetical protein GPJ59_35050, partial [Streptomyces bambusae]|nr:hypothetical protein [Streptomyces bambusae]
GFAAAAGLDLLRSAVARRTDGGNAYRLIARKEPTGARGGEGWDGRDTKDGRDAGDGRNRRRETDERDGQDRRDRS